MIRNLLNIGVHPDLSFREQSKIRVYNSSVLVASSILILYAIVGGFFGLVIGTTITVIQITAYMISLWMMSARKRIAAYHLGFSSSLIFLFGVNLLLGEQNQSHLYFLIMPMAALIVFDNRRIILFYSVISTVLLLASYYAFKHFPSYYPPEMSVFGVPNLVATGLIIFLGIQLFKSENLDFNEKINLQKKLLEEKNKDITDSIQYAKRIQKALMASETVLDKNLPEHFILYKPKDIVSGDFYWAEKAGEKFLIATCDCTGHGVPGAFMSLLGISFLNEIAKEKNIVSPELVFNSLREQIIKALNPEGKEEGKDGMDAVLCAFDFQAMQLQFACANNPLWLIRKNELIEFKPDKFPIGKHEGEIKPFKLQTLQLQKGDIIYTFTDGYADQFGGPKGKKFKYKNIQQLLLANSAESMSRQRTILDKAIEDWKGQLEQIDDILIIGIKI